MVCVGEWRARIGLHAHCKRDGETKDIVKSFLVYVRARLAGLNPYGSSNTCRKDGPPPREAPAEQSKHNSHSKCSNSCSKNAGIRGNCLTRDKESLLSQSMQESRCTLSAKDSVSRPEVGSSTQSNCHKPVKYGPPQEQSLQTAGDMHTKGISCGSSDEGSFTPCSPIAQLSHESRCQQHPEESLSDLEITGCRTQPSKNGPSPVLMQSFSETSPKVNQSNNDIFVKPDEASGGTCSVSSSPLVKEGTPAMAITCSSTCPIKEATPTSVSTTSPIMEATPTSTIDQYGAGSMGHKSSQHGHEDQSQQRAFKSVEKGLTPYSSLGQGLKSFLHKLYSSPLHLRKAGDIETNPGPVQSPPSRGISHQELYALAEAMDPQYYTNVGLTLGLQEAALSQHRHNHRDSIKEATYAMLCDWLKNVPESESRGLLVQVLNECGLKQLSERVQTVAESSGINPTLSSAMTPEQLARCKKDIASFYRTEYCRIQTDPLDVDSFLDFEEIFTNLFLLEEAGREKRPIEYKDLLSLEISGQTVKRLLLQGEAGAGKTTLCCKIAWDWLNGSFKQFELVVLAPLRNIEGNATIGEILKHYLSDNNDVTADQLDEYCKKNPDKVFILFDGLDEFTGDLSKKGSSDIVVQTLRCESLKQCTVLVSTRPWKADQIRGNVQIKKNYGFIGVQGFHKENLPAYIKKFFGTNTACAESLISFMDENDGIAENMAPFPIYTSMLCVMWRDLSEEKKGSIYLLQTFSQLFKSMMTFLVDHFIAKKLKNYSDTEEELEELHSNVFDDLLQIGKIAFEGLLVNQLNFTEDDFKECKGAKQMGCDVGVLTQEKRMAPRSQRRGAGFLRQHLMTTISFPHKLFQEYTAAVYLASLFDTQESDYDKLLKTEVLPKAAGYRYLFYFTAFMGKNVGLDIMRRLTSDDCRVSPNFVVDVAFECHEEEAARMVNDVQQAKGKASHLSIDEHMAAHTISAYLFCLKQLTSLVISGRHGSALSRDLANAVCSMAELGTVELSKANLHAEFYHTAVENAKSSQVRSLILKDFDASLSADVSRNVARWTCAMPCLNEVILHKASFHDAFHAQMVNEALYSKMKSLKMEDINLEGSAAASRNAGKWIFSLPQLEFLCLDNVLLSDDFYTGAAQAAKSSPLESLQLWYPDLNGKEAASREAGVWLSSLPRLTNLTMDYARYHDVFYSWMGSHAPGLKIETVMIKPEILNGRPAAARDAARWFFSLPRLRTLNLNGLAFHEDFYSEAALKAPSSNVARVKLMDAYLSERPEASRDAARWVCALPSLTKLTLDHAEFHADFYSHAATHSSTSKIETLEITASLAHAAAASKDAARWFCSLGHLTCLSLEGSAFHRDFYKEVASQVQHTSVALSLLKCLTIKEGSLIQLCDIGLSNVCPNVHQLSVTYERKVTPALLGLVGLPDIRELSLQRSSKTDRPRLDNAPGMCQILLASFKELGKLSFENIQVTNRNASAMLASLKGHSNLKSISMVKCSTTQQLDHLIRELNHEGTVHVTMEHGQC